jgi:hypothetical protein
MVFWAKKWVRLATHPNPNRETYGMTGLSLLRHAQINNEVNLAKDQKKTR